MKMLSLSEELKNNAYPERKLWLLILLWEEAPTAETVCL